ncbi:MAG TPA: dTDP-4-dehydrorhamnose reductase, partial [Candidatus Xenobia bacterium]
MIVVLGSTGQVGRACIEILGNDGRGLSRAEADMSRVGDVLERLELLRPDAVVNASAYTAVDKAEEEEELATDINGRAPGVLAAWCAARDIPLVHYSTDYVFDGKVERPWRETDAVHPLNAYGRSKLAGEVSVAAAGGRFLIFRTSWVYDATGRNFVKTMARLGQEKDSLRVVDDQVGAPTYAPHLAALSLQAVRQAMASSRFRSGIYHLCHAGETSWFGFAQAIFEGLRSRGVALRVQRLETISTREYGGPTIRPLNSRLDNE